MSLDKVASQTAQRAFREVHKLLERQRVYINFGHPGLVCVETDLVQPRGLAALCVEGIRRAARALRRAYDDGRDAAAREDMAFASLGGGLALANAGLGAVHGFAAPLGGMFPAPHGAVCAALLPHVMAANCDALRARAPHHPSLARYDEIGRLLTGRAHATAADGIVWVRDLVRHSAIPGLATYGVTRADIPAVVTAATHASSMKANPIPLTADELAVILAQAL